MSYDFEVLEPLDRDLIGRVLDAAAPPTGHLLVVAGDDESDGTFAGLCVPRFTVPLNGSSTVLARQDKTWDCAIILSTRTVRLAASHPGYFAQLLSHEVSHAHTALSDPDLHIYCCFIESWLPQLSERRINMWHQMPHEQTHDAFGVLVAEQVVGRDQLEADLVRLLADPTRKDRKRLAFLHGLAPAKDHAELRSRTAAFARPFAASLTGKWSKAFEDASSLGATSITQFAQPIATLFGEWRGRGDFR